MALRNLQQREKWILVVGGVALVLIAAWQIGEGPYARYRQSKLDLAAAKTRLAQAQIYHQSIMAIRTEQESVEAALAKRGPRFNLYSFITSTIRQHALESRSETSQRQSPVRGQADLERVSLTLTGVSLEELINLLHDVYRGENMVVAQRLSYLRPSNNGKGLDCSIDFVSPKS